MVPAGGILTQESDTVLSPPKHIYPGSIKQVPSQPSPEIKFPSSHSTNPEFIPSPQGSFYY
jgi:hypothetical protein